MTFSIPIDIKRCILEGIEPPDDMRIRTNAQGNLLAHARRDISITRLSSQARVLIAETAAWSSAPDAYSFHLSAMGKFPLLMPDDDFAAAINDYAARWGKK